MSPLESTLEGFFHNRVRLAGGMSFKIAPTTKGLPDRLVVLPGGRIYLVELKTTTGSLSLIQRHLHARLGDLGVRVWVLAGRAQILEWLRTRTDELSPYEMDRN